MKFSSHLPSRGLCGRQGLINVMEGELLVAGNDDHLADKERGLCELFLVVVAGRIETDPIGRCTSLPPCISASI